jgi:hypothetical protein
MGFHKRFLNIENLKSIYEREKIEGIIKTITTADAYICDKTASEIIELYNKSKLDEKSIENLLYIQYDKEV